MDLDDFIDQLVRLRNTYDLDGEGIQVKVNGQEVTDMLWDGNTTLNLELEDN